MSMFKLRDNLDLYYEVCGHGEPLVLIAGLNCDFHHWDRVSPYLIDKYQLILIDNRGVGRSSYSDIDFSIEDMADDIAELLVFLKVKQANILGHSMGGAIVQTFAYKYPELVKKVIISNSFVKSNSAVTCWGSAILAMKDRNISVREQVMLTLMLVYSGHYFTRGVDMEQLIELIINDPYYQKRDGFARQLQAIEQFDSRGWLQNITKPSMIIAGLQDKVTPLEDSQWMYRCISGSRLVTLPDAHVPMHEDPASFAELISSFLG